MSQPASDRTAATCVLPAAAQLGECPVWSASEGRLFWSIVLPSLSPILVTLAVLSFLGSWNDFLWPLIVLADDRLYTLPVALASLTREHVPDSELMMAGSVITVLPVIGLFLLLQRYYIRGLLAGSVKG